MALTNSQYDAIMREYSAKQTLSRHRLDERTAQVYAKVPEYKLLLDKISTLSTDAVKLSLSGDNHALTGLRADISRLENELEQLLVSHGYPADYLMPQFACNFCNDTGYIGNTKCRCFNQATINLLYQQSNLDLILKTENFDTFSLDYYANDRIDPVTGLTPLDNARKALSICKEYVRDFPSGDNILFYGDTGVGKTFLSNCIAKALLDKANSVLYMSAVDLFECMSSSRESDNHTGIDAPSVESQIFTCDLLIIDDLGTELINSFTNSRLFYCLNYRLQNKLSTVISTNFTLQELMAMYSERIFSRISSSFKLIKLYGDDIRLLKK